MRIALAVLFGLALSARAEAEQASAAQPYTGDFFRRSTLTGDWGGARNELAAKGITFDATLTQIGQGVVTGGKDGAWEYGARGNLTTNLDTQKLGLWPGGFLTLEVEGNFDDAVNGKTGALSPANTNQLFPVPTGDNFNVTQLSFAQFLSPYAGVVAGQLDTLSGDANVFAHGKGDTQFFNMSFNCNPTLLVTVPYSTLGAGIIVLPTKDPAAAIVNVSVLQANGTSTTPAFDELTTNKLVFAGEGRMRTGFFGLSGHQLVGAVYSNKEFTSIDQRLGFALENRRFAKKDGSWGVYYNFDQFLWETSPGSERGIGVFARFGASDGNPNPLHYFYSLGIGSTGLIASRPFDRFGLGYYYIDVESPTFQGPLRTRSFLRDEWGFEAFYNVALAPWLLLTPDLQVIGPSQKLQHISLLEREHVDTAVVLGARLQIVF